MSQSALTEIQANILKFIEIETARNGCPPTYRDIAKHFGYSAIGTVQDHVRALKKKGYLENSASVARGLIPSHRAEAISVPILGTVPAGSPLEAIGSASGFVALVPGSRSKASRQAEYFALTVKGDSMEGAGILEGDVVIVRKQSDAEHGEIVVAMIDGEATVKRLEKKRGKSRLIAENPKYAPIELTRESVNSIHGKVVGVQRYYG